MKPFEIVDVEQGTEEWLAARCGLLTGSRAPDLLATRKDGKEAAPRRDLRLALVCERLTGRPVETAHVSLDMKRGRELEPLAVRAYEAHRGVFVTRAPFLRHPTIAAGCSPDGYLDDYQGIIEAKAPRSATHLEYLRLGGALPPEYAGQVLHNLWITGAAWCDFFSYDPRFPPGLQLYRVRVERQAMEFNLAMHEKAVLKFLAEVEAELGAVKALLGVAA